MNTKTTFLIASLLIIISLVAGAVVSNKLPDQVASHWNEKGEVDGYMSKGWGVFMMPVLTLFLLALFLAIPYLDPLKENIAEFREIFNMFILVITIFMLYVWALTIAWNLNYSFNMTDAILPGLGILFIFVGYMIQNAKQNWFVGIRTPWTLSSQKVWEQTHRIGAKLFIASGVIAILSVFLGGNIFWFVLAPILLSTLFLYIYSFLLYQRENK